MVNFLETLYVVTAVCLVVTLYHLLRASRGAEGKAERHRRLSRFWGAATAVCALACVALYWYLR